MAEAERFIAKHPDRADGYNALAMALARRARETADTSFYERAEAVLEKSFAAAPANYEGRKTRVWVLLGRHDFARAYDEAKALNKETPDDVLVYGYLADAAVELGRYDEAERAVQWMLDLRSGNVPAQTSASRSSADWTWNDGLPASSHSATSSRVLFEFFPPTTTTAST